MREQDLSPAEKEVLRQRKNLYAARYRATHRLHLLAEGVRYRREINPDAYPRVASLKRPEDYTEEDLSWIEVGDATKRSIQEKVKGLGAQDEDTGAGPG